MSANDLTGIEATRSLPPRAAALLLAVAAGLFLFRLGGVPLLGPDEPRYARVAVEMHRSGDRLTPTLQGRPWLEKPVLYYWLAGAAYGLLGESETAARLPSALAGLFLVGTTALFGARLFGRSAGLHAGFIVATGLLPFAYARAASMDMLLAAAASAATGLLALRAAAIAGRLAVPAAYALAAIAVLAKGPLGLLLPLLVVLGFVLFERDRRRARQWVSPLGIVLFVAIAGPWYLAMLRTHGRAFVDEFLLNHNVQRFLSEIHHHPGPFWYYLPVLIAGLFPWSGLILPGLAGLRPRLSRRDAFVLVWLVVPLVFFSAAQSKLPGYILPCLPPLALLMGRGADRLVWAQAPKTWADGRAVALVSLVLGAAVAAAALVLWYRLDPATAAALPLGAWAFFTGAAALAKRLDPAGMLATLRVGAAGLLLLATLATPPVLARRESGRDFFLAARGREVLAWGAPRTVWMAGYFYNDGRVRVVSGLPELLAVPSSEVLVVCGPSERRQLEQMRALAARPLFVGERGNALVRLRLPASR
jgi:4-amino-4-deoxy-L-arabinose transferase-like glycosyltransferase